MESRNVSPGTLLQGDSPQERIANGLARKGLSIEQVAELLGVRWQTVQFWTEPNPTDRKPTIPRGDNLANLARLLGVTTDEILGVMDGQEPSFDSWQQFLATPQGQSLKPEHRRTLQAMIWPMGEQPTVATYLMIAASLSTTEPRS